MLVYTSMITILYMHDLLPTSAMPPAIGQYSPVSFNFKWYLTWASQPQVIVWGNICT